MSVELEERQFVSRYSIPTFVLSVHRLDELADADGNVVTVTMSDSLGNIVFLDAPALHTDTGIYEIVISSTYMAQVGNYTLTWDFDLDTVEQTYITPIEVGWTSPAYDALSVGFKGIIESVWARFADLFDSPDGGPHLQVYYQSHFGRGRLAQLLQIAVGKLNTTAQPHMTYTLDEQHGPFPYVQWGPLLEQGLYIETIKHLMRSYTEIPSESSVPVAFLDRRDYLQRWQSILQMEMSDYENAFGSFRIAHMGLGRPAVLVSGGIYGNWGPTRLPYAAGRPRFWSRFY
jgi:hypothetical protein